MPCLDFSLERRRVILRSVAFTGKGKHGKHINYYKTTCPTKIIYMEVSNWIRLGNQPSCSENCLYGISLFLRKSFYIVCEKKVCFPLIFFCEKGGRVKNWINFAISSLQQDVINNTCIFILYVNGFYVFYLMYNVYINLTHII